MAICKKKERYAKLFMKTENIRGARSLDGGKIEYAKVSSEGCLELIYEKMATRKDVYLENIPDL